MTDKDCDQAYIDGHRAGYAKGRDDGIGIGYNDAKLRAYDVTTVAGTSKTAVIAVRDAFEAMLGKRS